MPEYLWTIHTPQEHLVEVQHAVHSARVRIKVDCPVVHTQDGRYALWDSGFSHELMIDGTRWRMEICWIGAGRSEYRLEQL